MTRNPLDKELQQISGMEGTTRALARRLAAPGQALAFLALVAVWAGISIASTPSSVLVIAAAVVAGYMALNIGANDVGNNMGPAVGAGALTMPIALLIAAVFEVAGALIAGSDVVTTVASGLIVEFNIPPDRFVLVMISALLASASWVHLATFVGAPVSTTHAVIGGVAGAGIAAAGFGAVSWPSLLTIAMSWIVSPLAGGAVAALLLYLTQVTITNRTDKLSAARAWVPAFVAIMAGTFAMYLISKALAGLWSPEPWVLFGTGLAIAALAWCVAAMRVRQRSLALENRKKHIALLFRLPLILAAALLSFAHGANDVSNAIGPLAAIVTALDRSGDKSALPFWVLSIGALGIAAGLVLFGPRLIRAVGEQITRLNEIRAFCASLSTALTVLAASALGMPVSTTHIAIGAVFGIGYLREWQSHRDMARKSVPLYARFVDPKALNSTPEMAFANARDTDRRRLIRRRNVYSIVGAWTVTLPAAAVLAAALFFVLSRLTG